MSASGFNDAFVAALADGAGDARLDRLWDWVSRALPRVTDLHSLTYTERTLAEVAAGYTPMCSGMMALIECYSAPPLREWLKKGTT